jgi:hypothetical protein
VRFTRVPAIERRVGTGSLADIARITVNPAAVPVVADGAFWVDRIEVRSGDPSSLGTVATVDATTDGYGHQPRTTVPEAAISAEGAAVPFVMEGVRHEASSPAGPRADAFGATLTNVASVQLDLVGMGLCHGNPAVGRVTTDGPATVQLVGGADDVTTTVVLPTAGTHTVRATCGAPAGAGGPTLPATGGDASRVVPALLALLAAVIARRVARPIARPRPWALRGGRRT